MQPFPVITLDPPWDFLTRSPKGQGRSATRHYPCMSLAELKALPVLSVAARDTVLLVWVTDPFLELAQAVIRAWGEAERRGNYGYSSVGYYWTKEKPSGAEHVGQGYWTRANPEQCLLYRRGRPQRQSRSVRKWIHSPVGRHSAKPEEFYARTERLLAGPYLDLFARMERPGWTALGYDIDGRDIRESLPDLARRIHAQ